MNHGGKREGAGRPKGSVDPTVQELRELLDSQKEALVSKAISMALAGDIQALRICMDRILPALRAKEVPKVVSLEGETLTDKANHVFSLGKSGEFTVAELGSLMQAVSTMAKVIDVDDLDRRITKLENR